MNTHIDHTNLKPNATQIDIAKLCEEARQYNFRAVCVHPSWVATVKDYLRDTDIKIATVVGFPLGANRTTTKVFEATESFERGTDEIDMVWNIGLFKNGKYLKVMYEIEQIVDIDKEILVKVIVETCYLTMGELVKAYQIVKDSGAYCIKTSTGFAPQGAEYSTVKLWKGLGDLKIKAAGGIRSYQQAQNFIEAGANFLGTSHGVAIMEGENNANSKLH